MVKDKVSQEAIVECLESIGDRLRQCCKYQDNDKYDVLEEFRRYLRQEKSLLKQLEDK